MDFRLWRKSISFWWLNFLKNPRVGNGHRPFRRLHRIAHRTPANPYNFPTCHCEERSDVAMTWKIEPGPSVIVRTGHPGRGVRTSLTVGNGLRAVPPGAPKVCHPERRAKPEVEGSSHRMAFAQTVSAKILRLALLAQDDIEGTVVHLSFIAVTVGRSACGRPSPFMARTGTTARVAPTRK